MLFSTHCLLSRIWLAIQVLHTVLDPVPQAMVLTGIVVSFAATALALSLVRALGSDADETNDTEGD